MRLRKAPDPEALRLRMADLCARSEQCAFDILTKLSRAGLTQGQAHEIIQYLEDHKFISEQRFAKAFTRDKIRFSGWGRHRIRVALAAKRISTAIISEALKEIETDSALAADYQAALERVSLTKAKNLDLTEYEGRRKLYRFLTSRGFESPGAVNAVRRRVAETISEAEKGME